MNVRRLVRDYPITLTQSVNLLLVSYAAAFTKPTFTVFALLFTGAVLVKGRHTVTRMILAAGVRARHHARYHRFFSRSRWTMDDLWRELVRGVAAAFLPKDRPVLLGGDDTAQRKTGAKIYGAGMVHDNRPAARKGWDLVWGLTWVVVTVQVRVALWPKRVFALPVGARLYRKKKFCRKGRGPQFQTKPQLLLEMLRQLAEWLPEHTFVLHVDGGYASGELMQSLPSHVQVVGRLRFDARL
jgi:SRSO17 transposase